MQEAANGCGTIFLLKLNQLHPKCAYHVCIGNLEYDWPLQPWKPDWSMYRGGEFKEKLTLTSVGNQDGQMHDMVEILASGEVLSGGDSISKEAGDRIKLIDSTFPWYVKGCSSLGAFVGNILLWAFVGYASLSRKQNGNRASWA